MPKFNLNQPVLGYDGKESRLNKDEVLTYKSLIMSTLTMSSPNHEQTADDKRKVFEILTKISNSDTPELTINECDVIIKQAGIYQNALGLGRIEQLLNGELTDK